MKMRRMNRMTFRRFSKKAVRGVGTEITGDAVAKKNNDSVSRTAGEKIISMEARTSKETGSAAKVAMDKVVSMESGSSKEGWYRSKGNRRFQFAREDRDSSSV